MERRTQVTSKPILVKPKSSRNRCAMACTAPSPGRMMRLAMTRKAMPMEVTKQAVMRSVSPIR